MAEPAEAVQREARQLVEAAARWLSAVPDPQEDARGADEQEYAGGTADQEGPAVPGSDEFVSEESSEFGAEETTLGPPPPDREEHLCRGCPWCRAKAAAGPIGADTLDSLAHLLGAAAESLSLFAQSRRDAAHAERAADDDATAADDLGADDLADDDLADDDGAEHDEVSAP